MSILLCYDTSPFAAAAISEARRLVADRDAVVLHVWQLSAAVWNAYALAPLAGAEELDAQLRQAAVGVADDGARLARRAGFEATALAVEARGPVWEGILDVARERDVDAIVVASRGLTGLRGVVLGSVSEKVVRHADRAVLVVHRDPAAPAAEQTGLEQA